MDLLRDVVKRLPDVSGTHRHVTAQSAQGSSVFPVSNETVPEAC